MKNKLYIKWVVLVVVFLGFLSGIIFLTIKMQGYNINIKDENNKFTVKQKGLKDARGFHFDEEGNTYIAFKDKILKVDNKGKSTYIIESAKYDISSITYGEGVIYFFSKGSLYITDLDGIKVEEILSKIPTGNGKNIVVYKGEKIFISIPSSTNSGIASAEEVPDIASFDTISTGINKGEEKTGVFMPYGLELKEGEKIKGSGIGNASIITYDLKSKTYDTLAYGIKNIGGFDFNNEDEIFATVTGMENIGERPVEGDNDYIYKIEEDKWYGWPDYSGGDPITSPRFINKDGETNEFLIKNHATTSPKEPIYVHKNLSSLTSLAVDLKGDIGEKNLMYFFDNKVKKLYYINDKGIYKEYGGFGINSNIVDMKFFNGKLYILDNSSGYLTSIEEKKHSYIKESREVFILVIISTASSVILIKNLNDFFKKKIKKNK